MNTPTTTKATTAIVNATRNAGTAPSITVGNQFSAAPDVPAALIVVVSREHQILED
jgi:hypothetical protein